MSKLSKIYENSCVYLISYFDGINSREILNKLFVSEVNAKDYLNANVDELLDPIIICVNLSDLLLNLTELPEGIPFWMQSILFSLKNYCKKEEIDCNISLKDRNVFLITSGSFKYEVSIKKSE